jgi:hypothetical protein
MVVAVLSDGLVLSIGASGGGAKTLTERDAIRDNAFVKVRPINGPGARTGFLGYKDPFAES